MRLARYGVLVAMVTALAAPVAPAHADADTDFANQLQTGCAAFDRNRQLWGDQSDTRLERESAMAEQWNRIEATLRQLGLQSA
jgi:hypothetical protein